MEHYVQNIFATKTFSLQFCIKLSNNIYKVRNIFWKCEKQIQIRYLKAYLRNLTIKTSNRDYHLRGSSAEMCLNTFCDITP